MEPIYKQTLTLNDSCVDRYGRMKPSMVLFCAQEVAGKHSELLGAGFDDLAHAHHPGGLSPVHRGLR